MSQTHGRAWYAALMHPGSIACFALLEVNDHVLKRYNPGWLSGKLSDVACMVLVPFWLHATWLLLASWLGRPSSDEHRRRSLLGAILLTALFFSLMQTTELGDQAYRHGLGLLQYPFRAGAAWLTGDRVGFCPVAATPDLTDLLCLPMVLLTWRWGTRPFRSARTGERRLRLGPAGIGLSTVALCSGLTRSAEANTLFSDRRAPDSELAAEQQPLGREGFYLRLAPSVSAMMLKSEASMVSGFQQQLESNATAQGFGWELSMGHQLLSRWVLALSFEYDTFRQVRVRVDGKTVAMEDFQIQTGALGIVNVVMPFDDLGWHTAVKVSFSSIVPADEQGDSFLVPHVRGPAFGLLTGYEWRVSRRWWLGLAARGTAIFNSDDGEAKTRAFIGGLVGTATFF